MSIIQGNAHTSAGGGGFQIERSLRFNSADSAYLNRTPASAGNRKTWTWNGWVKRSGSGVRLFCSGNSSVSLLRSFFLFGDNISFIDVDASNTTLAYADSVAVFRDYSAWYCVTLVIDTTQATGSNRVKLYVNGVQQTLTFSTTPSQNADLAMNAASRMTLGTAYDTSSFLDCYLTEVNFIDGQALTPSSFGETDSNTGVWKPKAFSGTYGTNGFYLKFADNSGTTSTTLGKDSSGNGNNWTPNNFSVTAGAGNDSLVDSPTSYGTDTGAGGEVRGNYATFDAISPVGSASSIGTIANGNLQFDHSSANYAQRFGNFSVSTGKWYFEYTITTLSNNKSLAFGISKTDAYPSGTGTTGSWTGCVGYGDFVDSYLRPITESSGISNTSGVASMTFSVNDVIMIAFDVDAGKFWMGKNGTWFDSGNPAGGTNQKQTFTANINWKPWCVQYGSSSAQSVANFGQRAFAYTAPSGFKALCTQNLPTPTIGATSTTQANKYFTPYLYTADGTSPKSRTGIGFAPDFLWFKSRSTTFSHALYDQVRGTNKGLQTNTTAAENTYTLLSTFGSDGFTTTTDGTVGNILNDGTNTYVTWAWKANGAGSSNTAGTITSTVSASTTSGFSIVTYTGNGSANQTVGHGLGVAPAFGILKDRDTNSNNNQWQVFHTAAGDKYAYLSTTAAFAGTAEFYPTSGSSTTVTIARGSPAATTNENGDRYVMYLFAPVAGYSAFGSFVGNASTDGVFVYTGFAPKFILIKNATTAGTSWEMFDTSRQNYNQNNLELLANSSNAEGAYTFGDIVSNGFKLRSTNNGVNQSGATLIYAAFAEFPFRYSLAR